MSPASLLTRRAVAAAARGVRNISKSSAARSEAAAKNPDIHPGYFKVKETQQRYQVDNGLLVRQKHIVFVQRYRCR